MQLKAVELEGRVPGRGVSAPRYHIERAAKGYRVVGPGFVLWEPTLREAVDWRMGLEAPGWRQPIAPPRPGADPDQRERCRTSRRTRGTRSARRADRQARRGSRARVSPLPAPPVRGHSSGHRVPQGRDPAVLFRRGSHVEHGRGGDSGLGAARGGDPPARSPDLHDRSTAGTSPGAPRCPSPSRGDCLFAASADRNRGLCVRLKALLAAQRHGGKRACPALLVVPRSGPRSPGARRDGEGSGRHGPGGWRRAPDAGKMARTHEDRPRRAPWSRRAVG